MKGLGKLAVPIGVVGIVLMLVVPLPAAVLDLLLGLNITASLLILLVPCRSGSRWTSPSSRRCCSSRRCSGWR